MPTPRRLNKRQRRRAREQRGHDLRQHYRKSDLPFHNGIAVATFEDAYAPAGYVDTDGNVDARARLQQAKHADGRMAEGAPGWTPPQRPQVRAFIALKDDPVGRMHSRHQIDQAQYRAARAFQEAADRSTLGSVKSIDLSKTKVSGGMPPDPLTPGQQKAMKWLRHAEQQVMHRHGAEGLGLTRAVLIERQSVEHTARLRGAETVREVAFWTRLFQKCLNVLALAFGFASSTRRPSRQDQYAERDPARHANIDDLTDPQLRQGRR
jgi:hypothetical protein